MSAEVIPMPAKLECSSCGATANASCGCGAPYVPAGARARAAVLQNPNKSSRALAKELGVSHMTIARAKKPPVTDVTPATRAQTDGPETFRDPLLEPDRVALIKWATKADIKDVQEIHSRIRSLNRRRQKSKKIAAEKQARDARRVVS